MRRAILFDLDGTLLPMNMDIFLREYLKEVTGKFINLMEPKILARHIMESTAVVIANTDIQKTNEEVFAEDFQRRTGQDWQKMRPLFDQFYDEDFDALRRVVEPNPLVPKIMNRVKEKGYRRILATSPIFPRKAILDRMNWAGLNPDDFELITSYETMHAAKPNLEYYKEVLHMTGLRGEECIMVGNDVEEDLVAAQLGMSVFWLKDYAIHRNSTPPQFDASGSYQDLYDWISALPDVR